MGYVFKPNTDHGTFSWKNLGDIKLGRGSLGEEMPVLVYRLMQFTMMDILAKKYGREQANNLLRESGFLAGTEFARNALNLNLNFDNFIAELQQKLKELKIGILRVETVNKETNELIITVGEDLDCSGLPITGETVCDYDEGFIAGILEVYTGKPYAVKEIDCWANGGRICRFKCSLRLNLFGDK
jgi:predicted hydrocarbon binding protein